MKQKKKKAFTDPNHQYEYKMEIVFHTSSEFTIYDLRKFITDNDAVQSMELIESGPIPKEEEEEEEEEDLFGDELLATLEELLATLEDDKEPESEPLVDDIIASPDPEYPAFGNMTLGQRESLRLAYRSGVPLQCWCAWEKEWYNVGWCAWEDRFSYRINPAHNN